MIRSAVTVSLVPEMRGGPFVYWDDLPASCARAAALGFDAVELFFHEARSVNVAEVQAALTANNLTVAAMGSGAGWVKHKLRLTDPDARVRRRAVEYIARFIELAAQFKAPVIVGSMQGRWGEGNSRQQVLSWLADALNELGDTASKHGVPVLYEFLNRYESNLFNTAEDSLAFLRMFHTQNVKLLCDLFHMNIEERDIPGALRMVGPKLGHVHFVDSNRRAVGWGHLEMAPIAQALRDINFDGYLSAEVLPVPDGESAAKQTIESFRRWFR